MEFKVGDRVQMIGEHDDIEKGDKGEIVEILGEWNGGSQIGIHWDSDIDKSSIYYHPRFDLKYGNPLNNSLNKKLYPNRIEKDGYLVPKTPAKLNEENLD